MFFPRWIQSLKLSYSSPCKMWVGRLLFIWGPVCIEGLCWFVLFFARKGASWSGSILSRLFTTSSPIWIHKTNNTKCSIWKPAIFCWPFRFFCVRNSDLPVVLTLGGQETSFSRWCCSHLSRRQCPFADVDELILWIELLMINMCGQKYIKLKQMLFPCFFVCNWTSCANHLKIYI